MCANWIKHIDKNNGKPLKFPLLKWVKDQTNQLSTYEERNERANRELAFETPWNIDDGSTQGNDYSNRIVSRCIENIWFWRYPDWQFYKFLLQLPNDVLSDRVQVSRFFCVNAIEFIFVSHFGFKYAQGEHVLYDFRLCKRVFSTFLWAVTDWNKCVEAKGSFLQHQ